MSWIGDDLHSVASIWGGRPVRWLSPAAGKTARASLQAARRGRTPAKRRAPAAREFWSAEPPAARNADHGTSRRKDSRRHRRSRLSQTALRLSSGATHRPHQGGRRGGSHRPSPRRPQMLTAGGRRGPVPGHDDVLTPADLLGISLRVSPSRSWHTFLIRRRSVASAAAERVSAFRLNCGYILHHRALPVRAETPIRWLREGVSRVGRGGGLGPPGARKQSVASLLSGTTITLYCLTLREPGMPTKPKTLEPSQDPVMVRRKAVSEAAHSAGLLGGQTSRIQGRITQSLLAAAKERTGIISDTELLEYALAKVAIEDDFGAKLAARKGRVPADVDLEF